MEKVSIKKKTEEIIQPLCWGRNYCNKNLKNIWLSKIRRYEAGFNVIEQRVNVKKYILNMQPKLQWKCLD